jgi:hypothetical protein
VLARDQRALERRCVGEALRGLLREAAKDDGFEVSGHLGHAIPKGHGGRVEVVADDLERGRRVEDALAGQEEVADDAERVEVGAARRGLAAEHLRRDRAREHEGARIAVIEFDSFSYSKV